MSSIIFKFPSYGITLDVSEEDINFTFENEEEYDEDGLKRFVDFVLTGIEENQELMSGVATSKDWERLEILYDDWLEGDNEGDEGWEIEITAPGPAPEESEKTKALKRRYAKKVKKYKKLLDPDENEDMIKSFNRPLTIERSIFTLQGISAAIIYDGKIDDSEIELLVEWIAAHKEQRDEFPISRVYKVLKKILADNIITKDERMQLFEVLSSIADGPDSGKTVDDIYDKNPNIVFLDHEFLFTGKLRHGNRKKAEEEVLRRGGVISLSGTVVRSLNYLIVGNIGSESWRFGRYGRKIESAIERRKDNVFPVIAQENDFIEAIISWDDYG